MKRLKIRPPLSDGLELLKHTKSDRDNLMMRLCLFQALREGEILGSYDPRHGTLKALTLHDIDLDRRVILIHGKGGTIEEVYLGKNTYGMIKRYIDTHFSSKRIETGNANLFELSTRQFQNIVKQTAIRAGVDHAERYSPHTLRRISSTYYNVKTKNLPSTQHHARHKSWKTTMDYIQPDTDTRRKEEEEVFDGVEEEEEE